MVLLVWRGTIPGYCNEGSHDDQLLFVVMPRLGAQHVGRVSFCFEKMHTLQNIKCLSTYLKIHFSES